MPPADDPDGVGDFDFLVVCRISLSSTGTLSFRMALLFDCLDAEFIDEVSVVDVVETRSLESSLFLATITDHTKGLGVGDGLGVTFGLEGRLNAAPDGLCCGFAV